MKSYWQSTTFLPSLPQDIPASIVDVAIIGGGLLGCATSYYISKQGIKVALIEQNKIGSGNTGRNGGFVSLGLAETYPNAIAVLGSEKAKAILKITIENQNLLHCLLQDENIACDYRTPGNIRLIVGENQFDQYKLEVELLQASGYPAELLDRKTVAELIPTKLMPNIIGARFFPGQGLIHSASFVQELAVSAQKYGTRIYGAKALALESHKNHILIHTNHGSFEANYVVVATNAWTSQILPVFSGIIIPNREQMLAYKPIPPVFPLGMSAAFITDEYWQQTPTGAILIGGCGTAKFGTEDWHTNPTQSIQAKIESILPTLFPSLLHLQVSHRWAGLLDYTSDYCPIVDAVPNMQNVFVVAGFSGHGMPFGLRLGELLATSIIADSLSPLLDVFSLSRPTLNKWTQKD